MLVSYADASLFIREKTSGYTFLQEYLTLYNSSIKTKQNMEKKAENESQKTANLTKRVLKISVPQKKVKKRSVFNLLSKFESLACVFIPKG